MIDLGIETPVFLSNFFEKNLYFRAGGLASGTGYSWAHVERMLYQWDPDDQPLSLHLNGPMSPAAFVEPFQDLEEVRKRIDFAKLRGLLQAGATFVMNRVDNKCPVVGEVCRHLSLIAGEKVVANGYAAFGGVGTFGKHWDTHDVFAVQLIGRKRWRVFEPTFELPLPNQRSKNKKDDCPEHPVFDRVLEAGDVLYIPRGWWHLAEPIRGEETYHVAAGVHTAKTIDYLAWLAEEVMPDFVESRRSLLGGADDRFRVEDFLRALANAARDDAHRERFVARIHAMRNPERHISLSDIQVLQSP